MRLKHTEKKIKQFLASPSTRKWISGPDELQLQDMVRRRAHKAFDNPLVITVSAISDLESALKREILGQDKKTTIDPENSVFELFQTTLNDYPMGVLCIVDLECIDADCLVFLGRLVDYIRKVKSQWKVVFSGEPELVTPACLQRLGIAHRNGKSLKAHEQSHSEWSESIISIFSKKVL